MAQRGCRVVTTQWGGVVGAPPRVGGGARLGEQGPQAGGVE